MGLGKTYSTQYLADSNNNTGVAGQVLISTSTGVNWSDGTDIIGGPYLPLSAGSGFPLTGTLYGTSIIITGSVTSTDYRTAVGNVFYLTSGSDWRFRDNASGTERMRLENGGTLTLGQQTATRLVTTLSENDKVDLKVIDGTDSGRAFTFSISTNEAMRISPTSNVGINNTDPSERLYVGGSIGSTNGLNILTTTYHRPNLWVKVFGVPMGGNFGFGGMKFSITSNGGTSGQNRYAEIDFKFKTQNNDGRVIANITNNTGTRKLDKVNIAVLRDDANDLINFYFRPVENYTTPSFAALAYAGKDFVWSGTEIGANLTGEPDDGFTSLSIQDSMYEDADDGVVYITKDGADHNLVLTNNTAGGDFIKCISETGDAVFKLDSGGTGGEAALLMYSDGVLKNSINANGDTYLNNIGNVGIGETSPTAKLHVGGAITVKGTGTGTSGSLAIQDNYTATDHLGNIGWIRSSGGPYLSYGLKQEGSADWKSTFANFEGERSYMKLDNDQMSMAWAPAQNTAVGTAVTGLVERFKFNLDSGVLQLNNYSAGVLMTGSDGTVGIAGSGDLPGGPYLPLTGGTIDGTLIIDTDTGAQPFYVTRSGGTNQALSIYTDDVASYFTTIQDETTGNYGSMVFILDNGAPTPIFNFQYGSSSLMRIQANGNVGIGTTTPSQALEVDGVIESPYLEFKPVVFYDFNSDTVDDWNKASSTLSTPADSVTRYTSTAGDSNINRAFNFPGGQNNIIKIRYKTVSGNVGAGEIFYANSEHSYSGSYTKQLTLVDDNEWHTLVIDMNESSNPADWNGYNVTAIRFDLTNNFPVVIDIDWISVGGNGYTSQYFEGSVGIDAIGEAEGNLSLGAKTTTEGGHLILNAGTSQTEATHIDNASNIFRVMGGTNAASGAVDFSVNHSTSAAYFAGTVGIGGASTIPLSIFKTGASVNSQTDIMAVIQNSTYGSTNTAGENKMIFGWSNHYAAAISAYKDGTVNRTGFKFYTEVGYNTPVLGMMLTSAGNLGVGTTTPAETSQKLTVWGGNLYVRGGDSKVIINNVAGASNQEDIVLQRNDATKFSLGLNSNDYFALYGTATTDTHLVVSDTGNVGISQTNPGGKLDVGLDSNEYVNFYEKSIRRLPPFSMGASSIVDEYLVVGRKYASTNQNATGIIGDIIFSRGSTGTGNNSSKLSIALQCAYNSNAISGISITGEQTWISFDVISINSVEYYALKARINGGGQVRAYAEGLLMTDGDVNMFANVRSGNAAVSVVSTNVYPIVQGSIGAYLPLAGGTLTGDLTVNTELEVGLNEAVDHRIKISTGIWNEPTLFFNSYSNFNYTLGNFGTSGSKKFQLRSNDDSVIISTGGDNSANVGIGTDTPLYGLHVDNDAAYGGIFLEGNNAPGLTIRDNSSTSEAKIYVQSTAGSQGNLRISSDNNNVATTPSIEFNIGGSNKMYIEDGGNIGINDPTPSYKLDVNGTIRATGDIIAFSDVRVKENIKTIKSSLDKVSKLRGVEFNKIGEDEKSIGVIAQEIEKVIPEVVKTDDEGMKSVAYGNISGLLIEAIKELKAEVDLLKSKPCNCNCKK